MGILNTSHLQSLLPLRLQIGWKPERDQWWHDLIEGVSEECEPEWMDAEDPLFMLYTR